MQYMCSYLADLVSLILDGAFTIILTLCLWQQIEGSARQREYSGWTETFADCYTISNKFSF